GRRHRRRHRRDQRGPSLGRTLPQGRDRDGDGGLSLRHRHRAPDQGRAPGTRQVPSGLSFSGTGPNDRRRRGGVMSEDGIVVRPLAAADRAAWEPLWQGYQAFYRISLPPAVTDGTFARMLD